MPLDPRLKELLKQIQSTPAYRLDVPMKDHRKAMDELAASFPGKPQPVRRVEVRLVTGPAGDIPIRIYDPGGDQPLPAVVHFHGGGWCVGSIDVEDTQCRERANNARCLAVSVEYRLAPEHKFPAGPEDCYAATQWVIKNAHNFQGDPKRVAVEGPSSGGNLAAAVCLMARDRCTPMPVCQVLMWPPTNYAFDTTSYRENAEGYGWKEGMGFYWNHYLASPKDGEDCYASPLRAEDLSGLPPALVITGEHDVLRDDGEAYAARLKKAGVPVTCTRHDGHIHGGSPLETVSRPQQEADAYLKAVLVGV